MRKLIYSICLVVFLAVAMPAQAQLRVDRKAANAPTKLYDQGGGFSLNDLFSPEHFRMSHSYELSMGSFGGSSSSLGMYTNSMMWQFNDKLAARVDVSYAHSPMGNLPGNENGSGLGNGRIFLRNAEVAYRPTKNIDLHFSVRQSPYGLYMGPYGYYSPFSPYGYGYYGHESAAMRSDDLFWRDRN